MTYNVLSMTLSLYTTTMVPALRGKLMMPPLTECEKLVTLLSQTYEL